LSDEIRLTQSQKSRQVMDVAIGNLDLGHAAALRARAAIDLVLNFLGRLAKLTLHPCARFQILSKAQILVALLLAQAPDLDQICDHYIKVTISVMPDRLFFSCWLRPGASARSFDREKLLRQFAKMLGKFPLSMLAARGPSVRIQAIERAEPPLIERDLPVSGDRAETVDEILAAAREFMQQDCMCEVDAAWDLWQFAGEWKLSPAGVTLACFGPDFENEIGDHLRIELGLDSYFLPDPEIPGSLRMGQSNLKSLLHLVHEMEGALDLERRQLWSESGENPMDLIAQALLPLSDAQGQSE
jgi:hypothetical protein